MIADVARVPGDHSVGGTLSDIIQRGAGSASCHEGKVVLLSDTHAHLSDPAFHDDLDAVLNRAHEQGVDRILAVGSDAESSRSAVALAHAHESVFAAVGIHPHEADRFAEQAGEVEALLHEDKVIAIGEIGLDYTRQNAPKAAQKYAFEEQLRWARQFDMPVSVHNREADNDVLTMLQQSGTRAVLHCFSGTLAFARRALSVGCYISFAGNVTFPKAENVRAVARVIPGDRLLVESDSPVLSPQPWRGRRNEPAHIVATVDVVAEIREVSTDVMSAVVQRNADRVLAWGPA